MGKNDMPLSVLSALARLDVDPWVEAAELAGLPREPARLRLAALVSQLPEGSWMAGGSPANFARLIELLPMRRVASAVEAAKSSEWSAIIGAPRVKLLLCSALVAAVIMFAFSLGSHGDRPDAPPTSHLQDTTPMPH